MNIGVLLILIGQGIMLVLSEYHKNFIVFVPGMIFLLTLMVAISK